MAGGQWILQQKCKEEAHMFHKNPDISLSKKKYRFDCNPAIIIFK